MLKNSFLSIIFPKRCPYCGKIISESEYACPGCISDFFEEPFKSAAIGGFPCISSFLYEGKYRKAFIKFKFNNKKQYGAAFAVSIANDILKVYNGIKFDCITCVPLHKSRLKERGYNQSEVLAKEVSRILNIEFVPLIKKIKDNSAQHTLNYKGRAENVRGVYRLEDGVKVKGKTILLCDDIITTGHTMGACCKVLDKAGAKMVYCASFMKVI